MSEGRRALSMDAVAQRLGLSYERFRKIWRNRYVRDMGFPAPFRRPPETGYAWDEAAVLVWIEGRTRAFGPEAGVVAANDGHLFDTPPIRRSARAYRGLALMMRGT